MTTLAAQPQAKTGIWPGMSDQAYRALPQLSHSGIKDWVAGKPMGDNRKLLVGTALHVLALQGGDAYNDQFYEHRQNFALNTTEGKEQLAKLEAEHSKRLLRPNEYRVVGNCIKALWANPETKKLLQADGDNELCVISKLSGYATVCKCLIDMKRRRCLADLKSTGYRNAREFKDAIVNFGYASQAAFYVDLYASVTGEYLPWVFVCVSKETFETWYEPMTNEQLAFGRRWYQDMLSLYEREAGREL